MVIRLAKSNMLGQCGSHDMVLMGSCFLLRFISVVFWFWFFGLRFGDDATLLSFHVFLQTKKKENEKAQYLCGLQGKVFFKGKTKQNHLSEKQAETKAWETSQKGRAETKENGKAKENVSRYHDALMRASPFHPPIAKKY